MAATPPLDPRLNAYRLDLADERLGGRVVASRFVPGEARRVVAASAPLKRAPRADAPYESEVLRGEVFTVFESTGPAGTAGAGRGASSRPTPTSATCRPARLPPPRPTPTHRVAALRAFVYPGPDLKAAPVSMLSFRAAHRRRPRNRHARLRLPRNRGRRLGRRRRARAASTRRRSRISSPSPSAFCTRPISGAGAPASALDCSALVQLSLAAAGKPAPRDTDLQEKALGEAVRRRRRGAAPARRSRLLEGPRRHPHRRRIYRPCQRASHGGRRRAAARRA